MSKRAAAVALATKGFRVFLLDINAKTPAIAVVTDKAIADPAAVHAMWSDPFGASRDNNIGVSTDELLVLDFDVKAGREVMEREFEAFRKVLGFKHVVQTTSGGYHVFFRLPAGTRCASTAKKLGASIDTRSWHGYVVGPGSDIDGSSYTWLASIPDQFDEPERIEDIPLAPKSLIEANGAATERIAPLVAIEWDTDAALSQAKEYLLNHAPTANQGQGGDEITYKVACRVRDFGVSHERCYDLLLEHWNNHNQPPWGFEELETKVDNAYRYAKAAPHVPGSEYEPVDLTQSTPATKAPIFPQATWLEPFEWENIPARQWIVEGVLARGFVTMLVAPPGAGKTQWLAQLLMGIAFNQPTLADAKIVEPTNIWSWNAEDDLDELKRRLGGTMKHFGVTWDMEHTNIAIGSGVVQSLKLAKWDAVKGVIQNKTAIDTMIEEIKTKGIGVLICDPLAELHDVPENSETMKIVTGIFRTIAQRANCAVMIASHTRKPPGASSEGFAGNQDSVRGSSAQIGVARIVLTMYGMSQKDAKELGVPADTRGEYVRLDTAKGNIVAAGRGAKPKWFKFHEVVLQKGEQADKVGVLYPAQLAASRVEKEGDTDHMEVLAGILAGRADTGFDVSWQDVMPLFKERADMGERLAMGWLASAPSTATTSLGEVRILKKRGRGGAFVKLTLSSEDGIDVLN